MLRLERQSGGKSQENLNPAVLQVLETHQRLLCSRGSRESEQGHRFLSLSHGAWASVTGSRTQQLTDDLPVRRAQSVCLSEHLKPGSGLRGGQLVQLAPCLGSLTKRQKTGSKRGNETEPLLPAFKAAVPNIFGSRDWFHGRRLFRGWRWGVGGRFPDDSSALRSRCFFETLMLSLI